MSWRMFGVFTVMMLGAVAYPALYNNAESSATEKIVQNSSDSEKNNLTLENIEDYTVTCRIIDIGGQGLNMSVSYGYEAVDYGIVIVNTGNKTLTGVTLYEGWNSVKEPEESISADGIMQVNESWTYIGHYVVPREELVTYEALSEDGFLVNPVRVIADNAESKKAELKVPVLYDKYEFAFAGDNYVNVGADGHTITLQNNLSAVDPTYSQVVEFIRMDTTDRKIYNGATWVCADYAEAVHNNAEAAGIKAAWVEIDFADGSVDHACNAFNTIDRGMVYIDCTEEDKIVEIAEGTNYAPKSLFDSTEYYEMSVVSDAKIFW